MSAKASSFHVLVNGLCTQCYLANTQMYQYQGIDIEFRVRSTVNFKLLRRGRTSPAVDFGTLIRIYEVVAILFKIKLSFLTINVM